MQRPVFSSLRHNYKTMPSSVHTCSMVFPNTCAIRMSEALVKTNPDFLKAFEKSRNKRCPHDYMRGAQDLAALLGANQVFGTRDHGWAGNSDGKVPADAAEKQGIICYMTIPGYSGQGHIDLWNKGMPVGSEYWTAETIWLWELP